MVLRLKDGLRWFKIVLYHLNPSLCFVGKYPCFRQHKFTSNKLTMPNQPYHTCIRIRAATWEQLWTTRHHHTNAFFWLCTNFTPCREARMLVQSLFPEHREMLTFGIMYMYMQSNTIDVSTAINFLNPCIVHQDSFLNPKRVSIKVLTLTSMWPRDSMT